MQIQLDQNILDNEGCMIWLHLAVTETSSMCQACRRTTVVMH